MGSNSIVGWTYLETVDADEYRMVSAGYVWLWAIVAREGAGEVPVASGRACRSQNGWRVRGKLVNREVFRCNLQGCDAVDVREPEPEAGDGGLGVQRPVVPTSMFILTQPIYLSDCLFAN